jgi:hypothetical protein
MLTAFAVLLRAIGLACRGHRAVALENVSLRQQLCALKRHVKRPTLRRRDRLFWIVLAKTWRGWRTALVWCGRTRSSDGIASGSGAVGRAAHSRLVQAVPVRQRLSRARGQDGPANPLWGAPLPESMYPTATR